MKSVNLEDLKLQRTPAEMAKLAEFLIEFKDLLSDGTLDFSSAGKVKHDTTCEIITTVDNPRIVSTSRPTNPADYDQFAKLVEKKLEESYRAESSTVELQFCLDQERWQVTYGHRLQSIERDHGSRCVSDASNTGHYRHSWRNAVVHGD